MATQSDGFYSSYHETDRYMYIHTRKSFPASTVKFQLMFQELPINKIFDISAKLIYIFSFDFYMWDFILIIYNGHPHKPVDIFFFFLEETFLVKPTVKLDTK